MEIKLVKIATKFDFWKLGAFINFLCSLAL